MSHFSTLDLRPELVAATEQMGFVEMTPIQAQALPAILSGADVTGQAQTGSGKTAAFALGVLQRVEPESGYPQALVLCPTRELANQVTDEIRRLGQGLHNLRVVTLCGGSPYRHQAMTLDRGCAVIVATPGRMAEHIRRDSLSLHELQILVLDEADRMLDMGFSDEVLGIVEHCPPSRQTLLFSATFPDGIASLAGRVQRSPVRIEVAGHAEPETLSQSLLRCERDERWQRVVDVLAHRNPSSALVFCETRRDCDALAAFLGDRGASALALHGDLEQRERDDVLIQFANGSAAVLVATNVAARGLDISALPLVVIAELGGEPESHLHRIGRTGRAGESGHAISLVAGPQEEGRLERIEAFMGQSIPEADPVPASARLDALQADNRTLMLFAGRKDKLRKGDVLGALVKDGGFAMDAIGRIDLLDRVCAVAIRADLAAAALKYVRNGRIKNRRIGASLL